MTNKHVKQIMASLLTLIVTLTLLPVSNVSASGLRTKAPRANKHVVRLAKTQLKEHLALKEAQKTSKVAAKMERTRDRLAKAPTRQIRAERFLLRTVKFLNRWEHPVSVGMFALMVSMIGFPADFVADNGSFFWTTLGAGVGAVLGFLNTATSLDHNMDQASALHDEELVTRGAASETTLRAVAGAEARLD